MVLQAQESYLQSCVKEEEPGPVTKGQGGQGLPAGGSCHQWVPVYVGEEDQLLRLGLKKGQGEMAPRATNTKSGSSWATLVPGLPPHAEWKSRAVESPIFC